MKQTTTERLHIVEGTDWKDAVIALLDDRSPYRPWRYGFGEAHEGDPVALVLNTDPLSVMTSLGKIGVDGRPDRAVVEWPIDSPGLLDLTTLVLLIGFAGDDDPRNVWQVQGDAAIRMRLALEEFSASDYQPMRDGHSSVVAARVLLQSKGICSGCDYGIGLTGHDARDAVHIHTVDRGSRDTPQVLVKDERGACSYRDGPIPDAWWLRELPSDWPGVLCRKCVARMREDGFTNLVDFRFSRNPKCPRCWAQRTQQTMSGMPIAEAPYRDAPPWIDWRGCVHREDIWICAACGYEWS